MEALLRRPVATRETVLHVGELALDLIDRQAARNGRQIELLPREFKLLEYLMRRPGQTVTRAMLLEDVWNYRFVPQTNLVGRAHGQAAAQDRCAIGGADDRKRWEQASCCVPLADTFHTATFRTAALAAAAFGAMTLVLFAFIYWQTAGLETERIDRFLQNESLAISREPPGQVVADVKTR